MKKPFLFLILLSALSIVAFAQDTITYGKNLDEIEVVARIEQPTANHTKLTDKTLNLYNTGQNLPFLLQVTPSLVATSDDGLGIGYTYFRVRGTDHTRINMTINGVPLNDSESQTVFWVNMTDMASSLSSINVQRGVGTSTNGSSAFGASLNMLTYEPNPSLNDFHETAVSVAFNGGMYNTFKEMVKAEVQLPKNWYLSARLSKVNSDGYLYRAKSDLFSYYASLGYYGKKNTVAFTAFGGNETTYMAWDGVSKDDLLRDRRYNPAGAYYDEQGLLQYYENQNDYYQQQHYQLFFQHRFSSPWSLQMTAHYTRGKGYYEQMKADKKYSSYGLSNYISADSTVYKRSNFVRKKNLDNHFAGLVFDLNYRTDVADLTIGGAANDYIGQHFGLVTDHLFGTVENKEFYRSNANKVDANIYANTIWRVLNNGSQCLSLYADLQYRFVNYLIDGQNDEDLQHLHISEQFHFFNPKAGITYQQAQHLAYFNFAIANREPSRKNYTEAGENDIPQPERLYDYELGYAWTGKILHAGLNLYMMDYKNQLVLTGKYSDTGAYLTKNVDKSYRMGAELTLGAQFGQWFGWEAALTVSRNKILNHHDWVEMYDFDWNDLPQQEIDFGTVTISFSPSVVLNNTLTFDYQGFRADIQTQVVSKQYLDNTMSEEASLKPYTVTNLNLQYTLPLGERWPTIRLLAQANNLFNAKYESNGGSWMCQFPDGSRYYTPWFYAQAGINVHGGVVVEF